MRGRSKLWLLSAALMAAGAAPEAAAVTLYWRPCAGSMLNGSILRGYRYEAPRFPPDVRLLASASLFRVTLAEVAILFIPELQHALPLTAGDAKSRQDRLDTVTSRRGSA